MSMKSASRWCALLVACCLGNACDGGMDGAGSSLPPPPPSLDRQVFVQPLWQDQHFSYLVFNERSEEVALTTRRAGECAPTADCPTGRERWQVPANSVRSFEADGPGACFELDASFWGCLPPSLPVSFGGLPSVSYADGFRVETDSPIAVPGQSFTLHLLVYRPAMVGDVSPPTQIVLHARRERSVVDWLEVVDVRPRQGSVTRVGDEFVVELPSAWTAGELARIEVDVSVPPMLQGLSVGLSAAARSNGFPFTTDPDRPVRLFPLSEVD